MGNDQSTISEQNENKKKDGIKAPNNDTNSNANEKKDDNLKPIIDDNIHPNTNQNEKEKEKNMLINAANSNENEKAKFNETIKGDEIKKPKNDSNYSYSDFLPKFLFTYDDLELNPQYKVDNKYYFFFATKVIEELNELLVKSLKDYPHMFEPIKEDLIEFTKKLHKEKFVKKIGFFNTLFRDIYLLFNKSENNEEVKKKAKTIAFLLSQLKNQENHDTSHIGYFDVKNNEFHYINDGLYDTINSNFSEEINNYNEYIQNFSTKFNELQNMISNSNKENNEKKIILNYLIRLANEKIMNIEFSPSVDSLLTEENKIILKNIRESINSLAIQYSYELAKNKKFFFDLVFDCICITKDIPSEKEAFITKGICLDSFKQKIETLFDSIYKSIILNEDEINKNGEDDDSIIKKIDKSILILEDKSCEYEEKIDKLDEETWNNSIDNVGDILSVDNNGNKDGNVVSKYAKKGGNAIKTIKSIDSACKKKERLNIRQNERQQVIVKLKKIRNIKLLLKDINDKTKGNDKFKGLLISQKHDKNVDSFTTTVVY